MLPSGGERGKPYFGPTHAVPGVVRARNARRTRSGMTVDNDLTGAGGAIVHVYGTLTIVGQIADGPPPVIC